MKIIVDKPFIILENTYVLVKYEQKGSFGGSLGGNEEHIVGNWMKGNSWRIQAENLVESCPAVVWKADHVSDELGYITEEISRQCW